ncbi:uncharacterized protein LOC127750768 [Frankliniella occidentalis]|uniref:Uncharacterized protein LOC127750768 n=1 Tax=Frankliniella occidentalis TaxID=133901 RepID=A0A9C6X4V5_FRAOC|nr:uncharacterized protein LOC127750768 [Frankliniella occidentalis]
MPRRASKPPQRMKYSDRAITNALKMCNKNNKSRSSIRKTAKACGIPRTTLRSKLLEMYPNKIGRPTALSNLEESALSEGLQLCEEWGFPLTAEDVCDVVQNYLNTCEKRIKTFKNNRPGRDWIKSFLQRHPELSKRFCENVKRKRAAVSREIVMDYFTRLTVTLNDVPPENIVNYDETNFTDDPGVKLVIVRRGSRHPERVIDTSKSSTSVMFAVSGDGVMLPPYVVYKAIHLYDSWTEGGPQKHAITEHNQGGSTWLCLRIGFLKFVFHTSRAR